MIGSQSKELSKSGYGKHDLWVKQLGLDKVTTLALILINFRVISHLISIYYDKLYITTCIYNPSCESVSHDLFLN